MDPNSNWAAAGGRPVPGLENDIRGQDVTRRQVPGGGARQAEIAASPGLGGRGADGGFAEVEFEVPNTAHELPQLLRRGGKPVVRPGQAPIQGEVLLHHACAQGHGAQGRGHAPCGR
jgi:hypothetical protein